MGLAHHPKTDCPSQGCLRISSPNPAPSTRYHLLRERLGTRAGGIVAALLLEALLILLLFSMGSGILAPQVQQPSLTSISVEDPPDPAEPPEVEAEIAAATAPDYRPSPLTPPPAPPAETPADSPVQPVPPTAIIPLSRDDMQSADIGNQQQRRRPDRQGAPAYGPAAPGASAGDSEVVGTAPDGSPLYGARWYTEPTDQELSGYLSTAYPGSALIACRTAPDWRVEDCVGLSEYPAGSNMLRAVLAAAWQFRVRPPRRGNRTLLGSWVRIRITYDVRGAR